MPLYDFECPKCGTRAYVFDHGGGESTALKYGVPFLGEVPLAVGVREGGDNGRPIVLEEPESPAGKALTRIAANVAAQVSTANQNRLNAIVIE